ncbi:MAG: hypothetical protein H7176_07270 [Bdellovibrionales bacterium]|nr:hypothetical protein [Massilia sp.]
MDSNSSDMPSDLAAAIFKRSEQIRVARDIVGQRDYSRVGGFALIFVGVIVTLIIFNFLHTTTVLKATLAFAIVSALVCLVELYLVRRTMEAVIILLPQDAGVKTRQ